MFRTGRLVNEHETRLATLALAVAELRDTLAKQSASALRARIDELEAELLNLRASNRKEFGKLWYQLRGETPAGGRANDDVGTSDEFQALLDLQRAHTNGGSH